MTMPVPDTQVSIFEQPLKTRTLTAVAAYWCLPSAVKPGDKHTEAVSDVTDYLCYFVE
jgi:hypothetical protein